jgi:hypothetical protein
MEDESKVPPVFYKYRAFNKENLHRMEKVFIHAMIYFASPTQINDPFECKANLSFDGTRKEWKKYLSEVVKKQSHWDRKRRLDWIMQVLASGEYKDKKIADHMTHRMQSRLDRIGIFCMSSKKTDILMWSYYADGHRGLCLGFKSNISLFSQALEVEYSTLLPTHRVVDTPEGSLDKLVLTKGDMWSHECEWRCIRYKEGPGNYSYPEDALVEVIFGCLMGEEEKEQVKALIKRGGLKPKLFQAERKADEFGLEITEI